MIQSVLCIDDSDADQLIHRHRIRSHDSTIDVRTAFDGESALELLRSDYTPDLILLDINMPGMNGIEFVDAYEAEFEPSRRATIVVMSSSSNPRDRAWASSKESIAGQMQKPLRADWFEDIASLLASS